ncbi:FAD dependent oxidoreductase [Variovorax sp. CF079]|uniref:NAD(P)-binding protein n=1 Tax=Variovorax sp. CF079 TaxID=1882774 RepID=UPI0008905056|nr:FAD-dependent oxidoreductase [Variovorax sp. CF079]SDE79479.1 FAD dependent oxidoreductase [Variovorax sp. CF079]
MFSSDVIVIGGGLVGTAVAYGLGQLGKNITVLDEGDDVQARQNGAFNLCFSEAELEARRERLAAVRDEVGGEYPYEIP